MRALFTLTLLMFCIAVVAVTVAYNIFTVAAGYKAKLACSAVYVAKRSHKLVMSNDFNDNGDWLFKLLAYIEVEFDDKEKLVVAQTPFKQYQYARYKTGHGCALIHGINGEGEQRYAEIDKVDKRIEVKVHAPVENSAANTSKEISKIAILKKINDDNGSELKVLPWPYGVGTNYGNLTVDQLRTQLEPALSRAFMEIDEQKKRQTQAVLVVYKGILLAEKYAENITPHTPLLGWSMGKSWTNALLGRMFYMGDLDINESLDLAQWSQPSGESSSQSSNQLGDPKLEISYKHLLHMFSGLRFSERYANPLSDVTMMLFSQNDMGSYVAARPLVSKNESKWSYSSGDTNLLMYALKQRFKNSEEYQQLPKKLLFEPLGMKSAVIETDASGTFAASSFSYASARDWARFGLLYAQNGKWFGEQFLPERWMEFTRTVVYSKDDIPTYGAHFWLKVPDIYTSEKLSGDFLPKDTLHAVGHDGQILSIIPSKKLVVLRMGITRKANTWHHLRLLRDVLGVIEGEN